MEEEAATLYSSDALMAELERVLGYPKLSRKMDQLATTREELIDSYRAMVTLIEPAATERLVLRDADDDHVVAAALAAKADCIVSGDDDLLSLGEVAGISVLRATQAISMFEG